MSAREVLLSGGGVSCTPLRRRVILELAFLWLFSTATSLALLAWAISLSRELRRVERERDDLWDECNGVEEWKPL